MTKATIRSDVFMRIRLAEQCRRFPDVRERTNTRAIRERNRRILAASRICWLCGHDGADAVDHKAPVALRPDLEHEPTNLAPAHHFDPCPTCGVKCNRVKSDKPIAPVMRRTPGIVRPTPGG